jgi:hypothetical protein
MFQKQPYKPREYAPLFQVAPLVLPPPDRESYLTQTMADRWLFNVAWLREPSNQYEGIEECPCNGRHS